MDDTVGVQLIDGLESVQVAVGAALAPDHRAVADRVAVLGQKLAGPACAADGILKIRRAGQPLGNGRAALGAGHTHNGNAGLRGAGVHESGDHAACFHARLIDTGGVILVHAERLGQRVEMRWVGDGAVLKPHAGDHGGGKGGIPAPGHVALPHKED